MQIIPVIDLMGGNVVHAKKGQRDHYKPIQTPLCKGSMPHAVIDGLKGIHDFKTLYVADLDALTGIGNHDALLLSLQENYTDLQFWIDRGMPHNGQPYPTSKSVSVIGSESLTSEHLGILPQIGKQFILSLDFMGETLLGDQNLLRNPSIWPDTIIIMSLAHVGSTEGPDFKRLSWFRAQWPGKQIFAAGGVRHADDLSRLAKLGIDGALIASAIHSGVIGHSDFKHYG